MVKLTAIGEITWQKRYGGVARDYARAIIPANDGGYVVAGYTESFGAGSADGWLLKLDSGGKLIWQKTFGSGGFEHAVSLIPASGGGYLVAAEGSSFGLGSSDVWLFKVDELGNIVWQKVYGGSREDWVYDVLRNAILGVALAAQPPVRYDPYQWRHRCGGGSAYDCYHQRPPR